MGWTNRRNKRSPLLALGIESLGNRQDADVHKRKKRRCNNELRIELVLTRSNIILLNSLRRQFEKALYYGARMLGVLQQLRLGFRIVGNCLSIYDKLDHSGNGRY